MHSKAKRATKAERKRMDQFRDVGCIPCRIEGKYRPTTVQHVVTCGRREGHGATYGSCEWHHQGIPVLGKSVAELTELLGPSLALDAREFHKRYGTEGQLVAMQNLLLAQR
jgi:hypothetical protein